MKKIIIGILLFIITITLSGCKKNYFNSKIYNTGSNIIKKEFLDNNPLYVDKWDHGVGGADESNPEDKTFIVKDKETLNTMINENSLEVDFNKQMVLVYLYKYVHPNRELKIKKMKYETKTTTVNSITTTTKTLDIEFGTKDTHRKDASYPQTCCAVVVMDKLNIDTVTFTHLGLL